MPSSGLTAGEQPRPEPEGAGSSGIDPVGVAKALLAQSALRRRLFDGFFRQPSWDMLLCLYVGLREGAQLTWEAVCASSGEPLATAERWLQQLEQNGLVRRRSPCADTGETMVEITGEAASAVESLLQDLAAGMHVYGPIWQ